MFRNNIKKPLCIFCGMNSEDGNEHKLTNEHIIPQVLGGWLTIPFVCKTCNNNFLGNKIESKLKKNSYIVSALDKLKIQPKKLAYREANIKFDFNLAGKLEAHYNKKDKPEYYSQRIKDESIITPENKAKEVLKKKIERCEKKTSKKVSFDLNKFDNLPYDLEIPVCGTDLYFIKRRNQKATITISGLDEPIPFRIPAIIAFEHLAGLYYPFVIKEEFNPIREWILNNKANRHVLLNTRLRNLKPDDLEYLPYHFIRFGFQSGCLSAIVGLFGVIKFLIFIAEIENIDDFPSKEILEYYHVYDLNKKELIPDNASPDVIEHDKILLDSVTKWGLCEKHNRKFQKK